jgi:hypothetical protein
VDDRALQGIENGFINFVRDQNGTTGDESAAQRLGHDNDIRIRRFGSRAEMMSREERACAEHACLHFIEHQQRSVSRAQFPRFVKVRRVGQSNARFGLNRFDKERGETFRGQLGGERGEIVEGDSHGVGEHGAELPAPEIVSHQRKRAAGEAMESSVGIEQPVAACGGAGELDGALHAFTAGAGEEGLTQSAARERAKTPGEFAREVRNMALKHGGTPAREFLL